MPHSIRQAELISSVLLFLYLATFYPRRGSPLIQPSRTGTANCPTSLQSRSLPAVERFCERTRHSTIPLYIANLQPSPPQNEALALTETLLRIFRLSIPHMPKTAKTFAQDLTKKILPVVTCPTRLSLQREAVACFATLVECLSQDHLRLVRILGSVDAKLRKFLEVVIKAGKEIDHQVVRQLPFLMTIEAGLVSYCDLDKAKQEKPDIVNDVEKITNGQVLDHVFRLLLQYSTLKLDSAVKTAVVNSLGTIFETHPIFLLKDEAMSFLDATFAQGAADKGTILSLLGVLQTILNGGPKTAADLEEGKGKKSAKKTEKGVDMAKLIGDTEGFAESGVHTALMQRYIGNVSQLVLLDDGRIQRVALDIISLTVAQGLTNPMQVREAVHYLKRAPDLIIFPCHSLFQSSLQSRPVMTRF